MANKYKNLFSWVEIDKQAILNNLNGIKKLVGPEVFVVPVIKSNAYGHGMVDLARLIQKKCEFLAVVNLDEAWQLRKEGITTKLIVLSYYQNDTVNLTWAANNNVHLPLYSSNQLSQITKVANILKKPLHLHLKVETGTNRLGIKLPEAKMFIKKLKKYQKTINLVGIYSHFAASEEIPNFTNTQLSKYTNSVINLQKSGFYFPLRHIACSAATLNYSKSYFNLIRLGISLYGIWPSEKTKKLNKKKVNLMPALSWHTKIIQTKRIKKGASIGYGCTYKAKKNTKIAVIPIGYWEGYDRLLSNKGEVIIRKKKCPVRGRICMNLTMVDISSVPSAKVGERVTLIGQQGTVEVSAEDIAKKMNTINYEVVTRINPAIPRFYK